MRWKIFVVLSVIQLQTTALFAANTKLGTASWYSQASCVKEGTSGIMANGHLLNDSHFTCASWDYPFGTHLLVTNLQNNRTVQVEVSDRGPARSLYRQGRIIDLSKSAFERLAQLTQGVIKISVCELK